MRTQVRMSEPMGARLTSHLASPLVVATPGRVAHWLRVKTENPEEWRGRESEREREREREREGRDSCTSQREETKRKEQRTLTALSLQKEEETEKPTERREQSSLRF